MFDEDAALDRLDELDALLAVLDAQERMRARLARERELLIETIESHRVQYAAYAAEVAADTPADPKPITVPRGTRVVIEVE